MFFQTHKGSLQVFRYCSIFKVLCASALRLTTCLLYHRSGFFVKPYFLEAFELSELGPLQTSQCQLVFSASIGSFQGLPAGASEVILLPQRLALKYNTTPPPPCQHFLTDFFIFFCIHPKTAANRSCNAAAAAKAEESSPGNIQVFRIFAGSARLQQPAWAAFRSVQWVPDPIHYSNCLPGSSEPQTALPPH